MHKMFNSSFNNSCHPNKDYAAVYFAIVPSVQVVINGFCAMAAFRSREKLRSNYVYAYVLSNLVANILFGMFSAYSIISRGLATEGIEASNGEHRIEQSNSQHELLQHWWAFRTSFVLALFLTMSGTISSLIHGLRESAYFLGPKNPSRQRLDSNGSVSTSEAIQKKRNTALGLVATCWILPFALAILCASSWNCLKHCVCFSGLYESDDRICQSEYIHECSTIHQPLTTHYILLIIILWILLSLIIVTMLLTTFLRYGQSCKSREQGVQTEGSQAGHQRKHRPRNQTQLSLIETSKYDLREMTRNSPKKNFYLCCKPLPTINYIFKLMLFISILFIICSLPALGMMTADVFEAKLSMSASTIMAAYNACLVYCAVSPILLAYYMSGLRYAVNELLRKLCGCCTKTVVKQGNSSNSKAIVIRMDA